MSDFKKYLNVYEFDTVLPGSGRTVKFKPVTTGQMKELLVYENETSPAVIETALDKLITTSIVDEEFDLLDLYLQDRFFLMLEIRRKTKGDHYQFEFKCPQCGSQVLQSVNLANLPVKVFGEVQNVVELNDNISVELDFVKRRDQVIAYEIVDKHFQNLTPTQQATEAALIANALAIRAIITPEGRDDNVSIEDRKFFLEEIPRGEYDLINDWFEKNNFGVDFTFDLTCKHIYAPEPGKTHGVPCGFRQKTDIPMENFFF